MNVTFPIDNNPRVAKNLEVVQTKSQGELQENPNGEELPFGVGSMATSHPNIVITILIQHEEHSSPA